MRSLIFVIASTALAACASTQPQQGSTPSADYTANSSDGQTCHEEQVTGSMMMRTVCHDNVRAASDRDQQVRDLQNAQHTQPYIPEPGGYR